ncbi:helix-turn-helix transcriptional regulator [Liquorilactobacillus uvarum]|uniref:helix-turn-helix transcriptional regulator n=1 Tax=Liquorilactobacillus uvarum TaxID=303240 RepID=UPI00070CEA07|nr:helix-turn-helix transcriptional regulator [Liquorilactobacillus uvarum]
MDLSKRLVELRKQWNYSQAELAQKLYVSRQTISSWENAKTYPDLQSLIILANIYHKSVDDLIKGILMNGSIKQCVRTFGGVILPL